MENKSLGGALVDVFDAVVTLVKSEITAIARRIGNIAKAKGLGVVLLLAALVPLTMALIFLMLFAFYGLIRLGLGAWASALLIAVLSLIVAAGLLFFGLKKLGGDVPDDNDPGKLSDIAKDDLKYGSGAAPTSPASGPASRTDAGHTTGGHPVEREVVRPVGTAAAPVSVAASTSRSVSVSSPADTHATSSHAATSTRANTASTEGVSSTEAENSGIEVSTQPTFKDDMKKEGY